MRAGLSTTQQKLTPEAAAALSRAMDEAARRRHVATTPLHVAAALLAAQAGLLRQACVWVVAVAAEGAAAASAHPLHCRALELSAFAGAAQGAAPPVSNALVAALKRAQTQQRRGYPEAAQQSLLVVKVELEQLVLSILEYPSVSRIMREASFSSAVVKNTIEQSLSSPSPSSFFQLNRSKNNLSTLLLFLPGTTEMVEGAAMVDVFSYSFGCHDSFLHEAGS